jgi:hypothetical protein
MRRPRGSTNRARVLLSLIACFSAYSASLADPLHEIDNGAVQHEDSGWIFPKRIGEFIRIGVPQTIDGTSDVNAYYERVVNGSRTLATVDVYPPDSAAPEVTFESSKAAIELKLGSDGRKPSQSERVFKVGKERALAGRQVVYKVGADTSGSQTSLYFIDTGKWIVKIRAAVERTESDTAQKLDDFARGQAWESLGLSDQTCAGPACDTVKATIHERLQDSAAFRKGS